MSDTSRLCKGCGTTFPLTTEYFYAAPATKSGFHGKCKKCFGIDNNRRYMGSPERHEANRKAAREYYKNNVAKVREYAKQHNQDLRRAALNAYSNNDPKCACCGENTFEFLAIDHINGGGNQHRKTIGCGSGSGTYTWLKANNYPVGFRVLCHNCNQTLGNYGKCPHELNRGGIDEDFSI